MKKYGEYLKEQRQKLNLNQSQLARKTGISQQMISHWENNKGLPNIEFCERLADFYGISIDELVGRSWNDSTRIFNDIHHNQNVTINQKSK